MSYSQVASKRAFFSSFILLLFCASHAQSPNIDSLIKSASSLPNDTTKINLFNVIAQSSIQSSPDVCLNYASQALELSKELDFKKGRAISRSRLGQYYTVTDQYAKASVEYELALKCYEMIDHKVGISQTLNKMGVISQLQADYNSALNYYLQVLELEENNSNKAMLATIYGNLGNLYDQLNEFDNALEYYEKALNIFNENKDNNHIASVYGNLGILYLNNNQFETSLEYFNKAASIDSTLGNKSALSNDLANLALLYKKLKMFHESKRTYEKAINLDRELNNMAGIATDLDGLSGLYLSISADSAFCRDKAKSMSYEQFRKNNLEKALELALQAQKLHEEVGSRDFEVYSTLKNVYYELGDYKNASIYTDIYWEKKNEIFSAKNAREFARLESKQERELNQKRIQLLESESSKNFNFIISLSIGSILLLIIIGLFVFLLKQNRIKNNKLAALNLELKKANESKDKFFSILAHDLINTVGGVSEALKVLNLDTGSMSEKDKREFISAIAESSSKAYELLNGLLEWSRLRQNQIEFKPQQHDLTQLIKTNIEQYKALAEKKHIKISLENHNPLSISIDNYMINSVLANLISNAIKFTPEKGSITISSELNKSFAVVKVKDSGIGIEEDKIKDIFDIGTHHVTLGTNKEKGTGLGLSLCTEFMDIHQGKISVESTFGKGSTFTIQLPTKTK